MGFNSSKLKNSNEVRESGTEGNCSSFSGEYTSSRIESNNDVRTLDDPEDNGFLILCEFAFVVLRDLVFLFLCAALTVSNNEGVLDLGAGTLRLEAVCELESSASKREPVLGLVSGLRIVFLTVGALWTVVLATAELSACLRRLLRLIDVFFPPKRDSVSSDAVSRIEERSSAVRSMTSEIKIL